MIIAINKKSDYHNLLMTKDYELVKKVKIATFHLII